MKAVVLDSPFSDLKELLFYRDKKDKNLPKNTVNLILFITKMRIECDLDKVLPKQEIKDLNKPVLIICGKKIKTYHFLNV